MKSRFCCFIATNCEDFAPVRKTNSFSGRAKALAAAAKMVFQKLVCRDKADRPIKENGCLTTKICAFENIETYVDFIVNGKTPQRKPLAFYNGMTMEEYINIQTSANIYGSRSY